MQSSSSSIPPRNFGLGKSYPNQDGISWEKTGNKNASQEKATLASKNRPIYWSIDAESMRSALSNASRCGNANQEGMPRTVTAAELFGNPIEKIRFKLGHFLFVDLGAEQGKRDSMLDLFEADDG